MTSLAVRDQVGGPHDDSVVRVKKAHATHTATSDDDGSTFDTGEIGPGKSSKAVKFGKEGEFLYHCKVHGKAMSGTIVVKKAANRSNTSGRINR